MSCFEKRKENLMMIKNKMKVTTLMENPHQNLLH